jgi:hypothetical protein
MITSVGLDISQCDAEIAQAQLEGIFAIALFVGMRGKWGKKPKD